MAAVTRGSIKEVCYPWILEKMMGAVRRTYRVKEIGRPAADEAIAGGGLLLAWHCYLWILAINWAPSHYTALAGLSRNGEIISRTLERLGWNVTRGSSNESALSSLRAMLVLLKEGEQIVMTPDGPHGPPREIKLGAVLLQQRSGLPIIPVGVSAGWKHIFSRTWDKFELPLPGSRIVICYGEPIRDLSGMKRPEAAALITKSIIDADRAARVDLIGAPES
ncbi:MAG: DUF374 domain-containing protein [Spirochaetia bacterium]